MYVSYQVADKCQLMIYTTAFGQMLLMNTTALDAHTYVDD